MQFNSLKNIYFVGIKGVAMTALALCAQDLGIKVTGSDIKELFVTDAILEKRQIKWVEGFDPDHITKDYDLVITTGAHGGLNNQQVLRAKELGIPVLTQAEAMGEITRGKEVIAVCGVGGKTTTSALIAHILNFAGLNPSYLVGVGMIYPLGYPGKYVSDSKYFVCEADEFVNSPGIDNTPRFMFLTPKAVVVTNIEYDHPDVYASLSDTKKAYLKFFHKIPSTGILIYNAKDVNAKEVVARLKCPVVKFDTEGDYNQKNIAAALKVAEFLGIKKEVALQAVKLFKGTQRRFELIGKTNQGAMVIDDYAHHPNELRSVIKAAKDKFPGKRIVALFQPHTYSRTKALMPGFSQAFHDADQVGLMDIYSSARETPDPEVTSEKLAREVAKNNPNVVYTGGHESTLKWLDKTLQKDDILLTLGAGDIFYLHQKLCTKQE
jgi:UDP-N-acetylmuramate--alanine ligase